MSQLRSIQRKQAAVAEKKSLRAFDLADVKLTDIDGLEIDTGEEQLVVRLLLPVGDEAYAEYEEILDLAQAPSYLRQAARQFALAAMRAVRERQITKEELLCATCNGNCCRNSTIALTAEDVEQLRRDGVDSESIKLYEQPDTVGHIAEFNVQPAWDNPDDTACVHLREDGCSIYEIRPTICREYSAYTCEAYVEDTKKTNGKIKLRVLREG